MKVLQKLTRMTALLLAVMLIVPAFSVPSEAASVVTVRDEQLKEFYLNEFNKVVNAVKRNRPGVTVLATGEVSQSEDLEEDRMADFAKTVVANVFANEKSLASDLLDALNEDDFFGQQQADVSYDRGALNMDKVPVSGKDYVSSLTTKYDFTMKMLRNDEKQRTELLIQFPETLLLDALNPQKSDLSKVFDLPTNTDVVLTQDEDEIIILEGGFFQLNDIVCTDAYIDIIYNDNMELITYTSNINYRVKVSTYTMLEQLWPVFFKTLQSMGLDVGDIANFNIVSIIMRLIGAFTGFDPEESMSSVYTDYTVKYQMYELDWTPRYFGDVDEDNRVDSNDARTLLRSAVGLQVIRDASDLYFSDMDFDGEITSGDARLALRVAVGLEKKYTSKAMREAQLEDNWEDPDEPLIPDDPIEIPDEPEVPEIPIG
ncbi:MAG: hypothetical protein E7523_06205 [Ruminococcaceae bacterium]|nr:hypothetical protein [Oscillospiraceae bacterium]